MVMPNGQGSQAETGSANLADALKSFCTGGTGGNAWGLHHDPKIAPKDDHYFVAAIANERVRVGECLDRDKACNCPKCQVHAALSRIQGRAFSLMLEAIHTGDLTRLNAAAAAVEAVK